LVICLAGDGEFTMLLGDLLTTVPEELPIKIVVYDNGKLGFVGIEQKAAGLLPVYTDLKNPDFGEVAKAMGLWGHSASKAGELEESVQTWLAQPGSSAAEREGETDAAGDATLAPHFAAGRRWHGGLHRQGNAARQGARRPGNDGGEYSLTTSDEHGAA
jgi:thiamine pyrophosphate-dependent acetolactate synthase large subunit-like protein